jgi:hypothetical protein
MAKGGPFRGVAEDLGIAPKSLLSELVRGSSSARARPMALRASKLSSRTSMARGSRGAASVP